VFEGPDGVGKSELSKRFADLLDRRGIPRLHLSFPGREEGSLGKLVYDIHHAPARFGVEGITPSGLQLLHVAAHLDAIERTIVPALRSGVSVVLDRFWWSTKVYGVAAGVNRRVLDQMIEVENVAWGKTSPARIILVERKSPLRPEPKSQWNRWRELYDDIAVEQGRTVNVVRLENEGSVEDAAARLELILDETEKEPNDKPATQIVLELLSEERAERLPASPAVFTGLSPAKPSHVYDTYWRFAAERQDIFFRRWEGRKPPWTHDPILTEFKFTNVYRASDRVSQYLIQKVIYHGEQSEEEIFFRTILFKLFNKIETWELLLRLWAR
jgi:thymidylate kinase